MIWSTVIANTLGQRLLTLDPVLPIAWPNKDLPKGTPHPFLIFEHVPVSRTDATLKGGMTVERGFIVVTVMSDIGEFASKAGRIAQDIARLYPFALRINAMVVDWEEYFFPSEITITNPPESMQGYPDGSHWRTPVKITYEAT